MCRHPEILPSPLGFGNRNETLEQVRQHKEHNATLATEIDGRRSYFVTREVNIQL
jgi:hypothetical protein